MENELEINEQIKGLYKSFDFDPIKAKDFGMYVEEEEDEDSPSEHPKTEQEDTAIILKQQHAKFVMGTMVEQSRGMVGQDGGQPWFLFWNTQSLELLGLQSHKLDADIKQRCVSYLA